MAPTNDIETGASAGDDPYTDDPEQPSPDPEQPSPEPLPKPLPERLGEVEDCTCKEMVVGSIAAVAAAVSVVAMVVQRNPIVYASGITGLVLAPYSAFQEKKMTDTVALKKTNKRMEGGVDSLKAENDRLQASVGELEQSVENLQELEETLRIIKQSETKNIDKLEKQLAEQKEILASMKSNLKGTIMQNLVAIALNCDKSGDMKLWDDEIDLLIEKIENLHGVEVNHDKFRAMIIDCGRSITAVMEVGKNLLLDADTPKEERIFTLKEQ